MKNIRHIFFDLDNTLWDHRKNAVLTLEELFQRKEISEKYNILFHEFHAKYDEINEDLWVKIRDGIIDKDFLRKHRFYDTFLHFGIDDEQLAQYFEKHFLDEIINFNELIPQTIEILEYLKEKGYQLHVVSNGFHEVTNRKVEKSGLKKYFETVTSAEDAHAMKPDERIFEYSLNLANAEKAESVFIGDDWVADVKGAQNFGLDIIFFDALKENKSEEGLKTIQNLEEIKNFL